jgi:flagellar motility protein MotE (MotC chaperone)
MNKLASPIVAAVLAIVMGTGSGLFTFWHAAGLVLEEAIKHRPVPKELVPKEERERGWNFWTIEIENLAGELKGERERQRKLSEQLDHREAQLAAERQELSKVRNEIEGLRQEIATKVVEINADEMKNIRGLAQTYTGLTPRAAVAIIREMDDTMVVKILSVMKPDVVAPIFEEMSRTAGSDGPMARRAALLSDRLRLMKSTKAPSSP